jgi:hypothetical protein
VPQPPTPDEWAQIETMLGQMAGQQSPGPGLAMPPMPAGPVPVVDTHNPFMQQLYDMPAVLQTAVVRPQDAQGAIDERMVMTIRCHLGTITLLHSYQQAKQWRDALTATIDQMTGIVVAQTIPPIR